MLEEQSRTDASSFVQNASRSYLESRHFSALSQLSCITQSEPKIFHLVKTIQLKLHFGSTYMCPDSGTDTVTQAQSPHMEPASST